MSGEQPLRELLQRIARRQFLKTSAMGLGAVVGNALLRGGASGVGASAPHHVARAKRDASA